MYTKMFELPTNRLLNYREIYAKQCMNANFECDWSTRGFIITGALSSKSVPSLSLVQNPKFW